MAFTLPTLSLKDIHTPEGRERLAAEFVSAATQTGFMQVVDHGIPVELFEEVFARSKDVFSLPPGVKAAFKYNTWTNRGYEILGLQTLQGVLGGGHEGFQGDGTGYGTSDLKEGWLLGTDKYSEKSKYYGRFLHGPNPLPEEAECPGLRAACQAYYEAVLSLALSFVPVVALALQQPESTFASFSDEPISSLRLLHYPPSDAAPGEEKIGAGAHTDFGVLTFLAVAGTPGLEVWTGDKWQGATPSHGSFIVNVGDALSAWSNGRFKSSLHRVINRSGTHRYSLPFFFEGNSDAVIQPFDEEGQAVGKTVKLEEHLRTRYDSSYNPPADK